MNNIQNTDNYANFLLATLDSKDKMDSLKWNIEISNDIKEKFKKGIPILAEITPKIDFQLLKKQLLNVIEAYKKWQPITDNIPEDIIKNVNSLENEELILLTEAIIKNYPKTKNDFAKKLQLSENLMEFLAINTARPFLSSFSAYITTKFELEKWNKGYCPVCGDSPSMAKLTKPNGKRSLYCSRCETEWPYYRLGCPYCENKDADKISFLIADDYKQYRLYVCEKCKKYIKTVDERECGEVDLLCEDIKTADFDKLAAIKGYTKDNNSQKQ